MATVVDKGGNGPGQLGATYVDRKLNSVNRTTTASPIGAMTPEYAGELVEDTTAEKVYRANGTTDTSWEPITREA